MFLNHETLLLMLLSCLVHDACACYRLTIHHFKLVIPAQVVSCNLADLDLHARASRVQCFIVLLCDNLRLAQLSMEAARGPITTLFIVNWLRDLVLLGRWGVDVHAARRSEHEMILLLWRIARLLSQGGSLLSNQMMSLLRQLRLV